MLKKNLIIAFTLISLACFSQDLFKIGETGIKSSEGLVFYSLPKTSVIIKVYCTRSNIYAGPYFAYAEEMLGIKGIPSEDKTEWRMDSILISTIDESDPEAVFAWKTDKNYNPEKLFRLSSSGLIFDPASSFSNCYPNLKTIDNNTNSPKIDEYSIHGFSAETFDTLYKTVIKDTMYVKIPVLKPKTAAKTLRDRAKDAADVIVKIRERRYELLLSEDDPYAEVNVLRYALAELDKIEKSHMELFIGKRKEKSFVFSFQNIPELKDGSTELFRFSPQMGITDKSVPSASPVSISYDREGRTRNLKDWVNSIPAAKSGSIYYRIPDGATAKIQYKGQTIAFSRILVSQFGVVVPYSLK